MSVILAGKRDSRRRSTTGFGQNVVVEETSYQMFEVLSFYVRKRAYPPTIKITVLTFHVKKKVVWSFPRQDKKLPTYPSPKPTLKLTAHLGQNVGLREG